jgi:hypothetical protein
VIQLHSFIANVEMQNPSCRWKNARGIDRQCVTRRAKLTGLSFCVSDGTFWAKGFSNFSLRENIDIASFFLKKKFLTVTRF